MKKSPFQICIEMFSRICFDLYDPEDEFPVRNDYRHPNDAYPNYAGDESPGDESPGDQSDISPDTPLEECSEDISDTTPLNENKDNRDGCSDRSDNDSLLDEWELLS